jgi:hypothetical protein
LSDSTSGIISEFFATRNEWLQLDDAITLRGAAGLPMHQDNEPLEAGDREFKVFLRGFSIWQRGLEPHALRLADLHELLDVLKIVLHRPTSAESVFRIQLIEQPRVNKPGDIYAVLAVIFETGQDQGADLQTLVTARVRRVLVEVLPQLLKEHGDIIAPDLEHFRIGLRNFAWIAAEPLLIGVEHRLFIQRERVTAPKHHVSAVRAKRHVLYQQIDHVFADFGKRPTHARDFGSVPVEATPLGIIEVEWRIPQI